MSDTKVLNYTSERLLTPCAPFHFDGTFHKPSYFPSSDLAYQPGHFWQTMRFEGQVFGLRCDNLGIVEQPALRLVIFSDAPVPPAQVERIAAEVAYRYDLFADHTAFYAECGQEEMLAPALRRWRGMRPNSNTSLYEFLVIATALQNAAIRRSIQMIENLFARYGSQVTFDGMTLSAFWAPEDIQAAPEEELRALKMGYRAKTLKRQADAFGPGGLDEARLRELPSDALKSTLMGLYGIGPASVWYLLFQVFKRYDAFEYISPWEQKIYSRLLFDQDWVEAPVILDEVERRWGRWKMLAAHILFEDLFWRRQHEPMPWLEALIRR